MFELSSFGLTERELKGIILPNIDEIEDLIKTVDDLPVLKPLKQVYEDLDKHLWKTYKIRIVIQGNLSKFIQGVLNDEDIANKTSFCILVKLDQAVEHGLILSLRERYELIFIDTKRLEILSTKDAQERLRQSASQPHSCLRDFTWKEIVLPVPDDSSNLAQSFIAAQVFSWAHRTYKSKDKWENILSRLHHLPILSSQNTAKLIEYIDNKPALDEEERKRTIGNVNSIIDHGIKNQHSLLSVTEDIESWLHRTCHQPETNYIQKRYIAGCIDSFLQESDQTLQSNYTNTDDDTDRRFAELHTSLEKILKIKGVACNR